MTEVEWDAQMGWHESRVWGKAKGLLHKYGRR